MNQVPAGARRDAPPSDEDLVLELARGHHEALAALYARYASLVFSVAAHSVGSAAAEEIVQDTFLAIWRGAHLFDVAEGPFKPWMLRQAHWRVLNELRRRRRHPDETDQEAPLLRIADAEPGPDELVWRDERAHLMRAALESLSPKQRQAVALAFMADLTHEQVAQTLGVPLGTAKTRIRDGVLRLRAALLPIAASLLVILTVTLGTLRLAQQQHELARNQRAVALLTSSTLTAIRVESVLGSEAHATYRFEPGSDVAVLSLSHAPAGVYEARAQIAGRWLPLGQVTVDADGRGELIVEERALGSPPDALQVSANSQLVLDWRAP